MCDHCGCRAFPAIAELTADHETILSLAWPLAEADRRGDTTDPTVRDELLAILDAHVGKEETSLYPLLLAAGDLSGRDRRHARRRAPNPARRTDGRQLRPSRRARACRSALVRGLTLLPATGVAEDAYEQLSRSFDGEEIVALTLAIIAVNGGNRLRMGLDGASHPGEHRGPPASKEHTADPRVRELASRLQQLEVQIALVRDDYRRAPEGPPHPRYYDSGTIHPELDDPDHRSLMRPTPGYGRIGLPPSATRHARPFRYRGAWSGDSGERCTMVCSLEVAISTPEAVAYRGLASGPDRRRRP